MLRKRRDANAAGGETGEQPSLQTILDRLGEQRAWLAGRLDELSTRVDNVEALLVAKDAPAEPAAGDEGRTSQRRGKEGLSREEIVAIRATKKRARRAARLKAEHEGAADREDQEASG